MLAADRLEHARLQRRDVDRGGREFGRRVGEVVGEVRAKLGVERFGALHEVAAAAAGDEMRIRAQALVAREFVVEIRRKRRLQGVAVDRAGGNFVVGVVHGRSQSLSGGSRFSIRRGRC
jgi:hypothetical protein